MTPKEIEAYLSNERKEYQKYKTDPKLLLLGASDSGKSTLLKQLKILHGGGFSDKERDVAKRRVVTGVFLAINRLVSLAGYIEIQEVTKVDLILLI
jgi:guanine nucleotide-binding protein G(q) subunit alpha